MVHSRRITWQPKKGPTKTTVPLQGNSMGFHVDLGECNCFLARLTPGQVCCFGKKKA